jgi:hypothetical protein
VDGEGPVDKDPYLFRVVQLLVLQLPLQLPPTCFQVPRSLGKSAWLVGSTTSLLCNTNGHGR